MEPLEVILCFQPHYHGFASQGDQMDYRRYIEGRIIDIGYTKARMQRLFSILSDADYDALQRLLGDAENILKGYLEKGS